MKLFGIIDQMFGYSFFRQRRPNRRDLKKTKKKNAMGKSIIFKLDL